MTTSLTRREWRLAGIGLVAGLFSGLFGVGGGVIVVPLLIATLGYDARVATATSLAGIVITSLAGTASHAALGNVDVAKALAIGLPAVAGVLAGVALKRRISSAALTYAFAVLVALIAVRMLLPRGGHLDLPNAGAEVALAGGIGLVAGIVAGLFGVGGGALFVPALALAFGLMADAAAGTSLLAMIPVSIVGSVRQRNLVRWHDALLLGVGSTATAFLGALIAAQTPDRVLRTLFAGLLVLTAIDLVRRARQ